MPHNGSLEQEDLRKNMPSFAHNRQGYQGYIESLLSDNLEVVFPSFLNNYLSQEAIQKFLEYNKAFFVIVKSTSKYMVIKDNKILYLLKMHTGINYDLIKYQNNFSQLDKAGNLIEEYDDSSV